MQTRLDSKGVRLDVYVEDGSRSFNLEMQMTDSSSLGQRMRYYQGLIDMDKIGKGQTYEVLGETYIIFLCNFDHFKQGKYIYTFKEFCVEDRNLELGDGTTKVFLNAQGKGEISEEIKAIADSIMGIENYSPLAQEISESVERVKLAKEWRLEYVTFEMLLRERELKGKEQGRAEGRAEGKVEGEMSATLKNLKNLMKAMNLSIEQAMNVLNIPIEERSKYINAL